MTELRTSMLSHLSVWLRSYWSISNRFFYRMVSGRADPELQKRLRMANINLPYETYSSMRLMSALILFTVGLILGYASTYALLGMNAALIAILMGAVLSGAAYYMFTTYPGMAANNRRNKIDASLPHAVTYLYALTRGGTSVLDTLRSIAELQNIYSESAVEIGLIVRDVEYFGLDLSSALEKGRSRTPSNKLRDFLDGLISVIDSGGYIPEYLGSKAEHYQETAVEDQKVFLESLSTFAEAYVTAFVAGPLFMITLLLMMGFVGEGYISVLKLIIYIVLPLSTLGFLLVLDIILPLELQEQTMHATWEKLNMFKDVKVMEKEAKTDATLLDQLQEYERRKKWRKFLKDPLRMLYEKPVRTFYVSLPIGLAIFLSQAYANWELIVEWLKISSNWLFGITPSPVALVMDDSIVLMVLIITVPFTILYELRRRRIRRIEKEIPEFLKRLSSIHQAGLTLTKAIRIIVNSKLGVLTTEIKRIWRSIEWGALTTDALIRFQRRVGTSAIARTMTLIVNASRSSPNINDVLDIAARDAAIGERLKRERFNNMLMYVLIVYVSFAVFMVIVLVLSAVFLPIVPIKGLEGLEGGAIAASLLVSKGTGKEMYELLFFHAALIQGFFTGLVAGKMGEGSARSGLKHSVIMVLTTYIMFMVVVW